MKYSIIVPTRNAEKYLERNIKSILKQTFQNWEAIYIDGGSSDRTKDIVAKYSMDDPRIKLIESVDKCYAEAVNKGIKVASGDVISYIGSDDEYQPWTLQSAAKYLEGNDFVFGNYITVNKDGDYLYTTYVIPKVSKFLLLYGGPYLQIGASFFRRKIFDSLKLDESLIFHGDYDFWLKIADRKLKYCRIHTPLMQFRRHNENLTTRTQENIDDFLRELNLVRRKHGYNPRLKKLGRLLLVAAKIFYNPKIILDAKGNLKKLRIVRDKL